ncbi:hypothetical protein ALC57_01874 [Trachymyrmex cornetzi]|uniref:Integrase catalytic domain-containing protein n=1 Tax=Trachymyrmex cornetzi TaxID=471704 RepID=A0A151JPX9_9HYME|nr:hypothetical protein ALC57_01874 [Trachymyrmex cornetzi]
MDNNKDREEVAKDIAKTRDSIRKKYRALKTGKMEEGIALERHFKKLKAKNGNNVTNAIAKIIRDDKRCPKNLQTDRGKEFYNSNVQKLLKHPVIGAVIYSVTVDDPGPCHLIELVKIRDVNNVKLSLCDKCVYMKYHRLYFSCSNSNNVLSTHILIYVNIQTL